MGGRNSGGSGSGGGSDGGGSGDGGGDSGSQSLDFWLFGGIPAEREYISNHYSSYSDHDVAYQHQEWGQKYQIIMSAAANNNLPDVMADQTQQIPGYVDASAIQPLDQEQFADQLEGINSRFIQVNVDTQIYDSFGDTEGERQWGLPGGCTDLDPFVNIRTDYLEQTSFDSPPRNWEELIQPGEEIQELDKVSAAITAPGIDFGLTTGYFTGFVYTNGSRYFDPETLETMVDQPGFVDTVRLYQDIAEAGLFPGSMAENDHIGAGRLLREGESGIFITYSCTNAVYQATGVPRTWLDGEGHTVTRASLPDSPLGSFEPRDLLLQNAQGFVLSNGTDPEAELQAAFDLTEWRNSKEQLAPWIYDARNDVGIHGRAPTLESAFEDPSDLFRSQFGDLVTLYENDDLFMRTSRFPSSSSIISVQSIINTEVIQPVVLGNVTAEGTCSAANESVREVIDEELAWRYDPDRRSDDGGPTAVSYDHELPKADEGLVRERLQADSGGR